MNITERLDEMAARSAASARTHSLADFDTSDEDYAAAAARHAAARTDLPATIAALRAVLAPHVRNHVHGESDAFDFCTADSWGWPCPTVVAVATALGVQP